MEGTTKRKEEKKNLEEATKRKGRKLFGWIK